MRIEDLADRPIDFHHDVAEQAGAALAANLSETSSGTCTIVCGTYRKNGRDFVAVDEVDRVLGVLRRELRHVLRESTAGSMIRCLRTAAAAAAFAFAFGGFGDSLRSSGCSGHMSLEYGRPKYSSKPCCSGRNCL